MAMLSLFTTLVLVAPPLLPPPSDAWGKCSAKNPAAKISTLVNISQAQAERLVSLAFTNRLGIVMRPVGGDAPKRRGKGWSPKPLAIKWKTCNAIDMAIGAPPDCSGGLVLFRPTLPSTWPDGANDRLIWKNRIAQRLAEGESAHHPGAVVWRGDFARIYRDDKCHLVAKPDPDCLVGFRTADGFVRDKGNKQPFTGDLDLFDITNQAGHQLPTTDADKLRLMSAMQGDLNLDVLHGAHMDWDLSKEDTPAKLAKAESIRQPILDVHRERPIGSPTREPLIVVRPD